LNAMPTLQRWTWRTLLRVDLFIYLFFFNCNISFSLGK
jgi:hypothetical protein